MARRKNKTHLSSRKKTCKRTNNSTQQSINNPIDDDDSITTQQSDASTTVSNTSTSPSNTNNKRQHPDTPVAESSKRKRKSSVTDEKKLSVLHKITQDTQTSTVSDMMPPKPKRNPKAATAGPDNKRTTRSMAKTVNETNITQTTPTKRLSTSQPIHMQANVPHVTLDPPLAGSSKDHTYMALSLQVQEVQSRVDGKYPIYNNTLYSIYVKQKFIPIFNAFLSIFTPVSISVLTCYYSYKILLLPTP